MYLVLEDYADGSRVLRSGSLVDDAVALALAPAGLAAVPFNAGTMAAPLAGFLALRGSRAPSFSSDGDLASALLAAGAIGGSGGGGGSGGLTFADYGTQDTAAGRYTSWTDLMAALSAMQIGSAPIITVSLVTVPFAVPLAGMPVTGWDFRGGTLRGATPSLGSLVLDCAPGVKLDNLAGLEWLVIKIAPPAGTGVLEFTAALAGGARVFLNRGGFIDHTTDVGAFIRSPGVNPGGDVSVLANFEANWAFTGPLTGPLVFLSNDGGQENDGAVFTQIGCLGGVPDGALANNNLFGTLVSIHDSTANPNMDNLPVWAPGYSGTLTFAFSADAAILVPYSPASLPTWSGINPTSVADALDRLAAAVAGLLGGPIP